MRCFEANANVKIVEEAVIKASLKGDFSYINQYPEGKLRYVFAKMLGRRKTKIVCNYPIGFLYWGLSEYAYRKGCKRLIQHLEQKSQAYLNTDGSLKYKLKVVDQTPMGLYYINMYKATGSKRYLQGALYISDFLIARYKEDQLMYRKGSDAQLVDTLGLVVPFLVEFSKLVQDENYYNIAKDIYDTFLQKAVDTTTGFPFHGYNIKTNQKLGSANWGRGLGWFLLASSYLNVSLSYPLDYVNIIKTQFINQYSMLDSSVVLLTELYKVKSKISYNPDWSFMNTLIRRDGLVDFCSGDTNGFNDYAKHYGLGGLSNGLFLLILSQK